MQKISPPGDHRLLLFYDVLFAGEGHQPHGDAGRSQVCDADDGVAVFHGCGRCNQKEERAKESSFSVVADLPCQHRARSAELVGRSKRQRCHLSTWPPNILPERKHCHDARARVLLDALPILPATQSKVSPKGPSIYEVHLKRGKELEGSNPKAKVVVLPAQKVFALEM